MTGGGVMSWRLAYRGPGWQEWALSVFCTGLTSYQIQNYRSAGDPQTSLRYYMETPGVLAMQAMATAINIAVLATTLAWILFGDKRRIFARLTPLLAAGGFVLAWTELTKAVALLPSPVFTLTELPLRPIGNMGLVGAQVFLTYLLLRLPNGRLPANRAVLLKLAFAAGALIVQVMAWDGVFAGRLAGANP